MLCSATYPNRLTNGSSAGVYFRACHVESRPMALQEAFVQIYADLFVCLLQLLAQQSSCESSPRSFSPIAADIRLCRCAVQLSVLANKQCLQNFLDAWHSYFPLKIHGASAYGIRSKLMDSNNSQNLNWWCTAIASHWDSSSTSVVVHQSRTEPASNVVRLPPGCAVLLAQTKLFAVRNLILTQDCPIVDPNF